MQEHKEELVEIKKELLKWCPRNFRFKVGLQFASAWRENLACIEFLGVYSSKWIILKGDTVTVNPQEYEEAVISRIKEMLPHLTKIRKVTTISGKTNVIAFASDDVLRTSVIISADPRPNIESYTIELTD